jgi:hypothetical protein
MTRLGKHWYTVRDFSVVVMQFAYFWPLGGPGLGVHNRGECLVIG